MWILAQKSGTALLCDGRSLSYTELDSWSRALGSQVSSLGESVERTVGILAPSGFEFAAALTGIWKAGAIAVPLQPHHPAAELQYIIQDARVTDIFVHEGFLALAQSLKEKTSFRIHTIRRENSDSKFPPHAQTAAALMIYTSGTTSRPKGVITTYGSLNAQIRSLLQAWGWSESDKTLNVLPLHHVHGLVNILA